MSTQPNINLVTHLYRCRLGRRELDALFTVAGQGFQPGEVELSHERHSSTFTAATLTDLVSVVRAAPLPGDPDAWDNLTFRATDPTGRRTVTLTLSPKRVTTAVSGSDATLVYGSDSQIRLFLLDGAVGGRPSPALGSSLGPAYVVLLFSVVTISMLWSAFVGATRDDIGNMSRRMGILIERSGSLLMAGYTFLGLCMVLHMLASVWVRRGVLAPTRVLPTGGIWSRLTAMEKITAAGVLVAAVAGVGTLISAGADLFK
ncbi:hypothetical protein ABT144_29505 [Streptomyces sp. NPDC002039]|uniref:hypothetical protein n=1 Tax=Streptomyces sp. NPDC002039 TaxID=3154660 RepID=UPI00331A3053